MKSPEEALRSVVAEWVGKAEKDFQAAVRLLEEGAYFSEIVGFHSQQAAEKYLKAMHPRCSPAGSRQQLTWLFE